MDLAKLLETYHALEAQQSLSGRPFFSNHSVRFKHDYSTIRLLDKVRPAGLLFDASGAGAFAVNKLAELSEVIVLDLSRAALRCARKTFEGQSKISLSAAALWDTPVSQADSLVFLPSTDKGNLRVDAEFWGAHAALKPNGAAYLAMHKDQGAKRYEKRLETIFGQLDILAKEAGWRLMKAVKKTSHEMPVAPVQFEASGLTLEADPGVYAAGKLDPGTAFLLEAYPLLDLTGKQLLDLGCGYGLLALKAALAGAAVTALDDDLLAVRSSYRNAQTYGLDIRCLHSDLDSELRPAERFDLVLMNPPFHLGKQVSLELPYAFIAAAHQHLNIGGELVFVANKALRYERVLADFNNWEKLAENQTFKVVRAIK